MSITAHREKLAELLPDKSIVILYSGIVISVTSC